jgi:hypothetical protein
VRTVDAKYVTHDPQRYKRLPVLNSYHELMILHHSKQERSKRGTAILPVDNAKKEPSLRSGSKVNREASNKAAEWPLQTQDAWIATQSASIYLSFH